MHKLELQAPLSPNDVHAKQSAQTADEASGCRVLDGNLH
jgi:hypothetical protein